MKILSISPFLQGATVNPFFGGKCVISLKLTNALVEAGHEVFILPWEDEKIWEETKFQISNDVSYATALPTMFVPSLTSLSKDILKSFKNKKALKNPQKHIWEFVRDSLYDRELFLKKAMKAVKPDLVHVHYTYSNAANLYRKQKHSAPLLLTHHSKGLTDNISLYDYVVFVSKSQYEEACSLQQELENKGRYIHNCIDQQYFRPAEPSESNTIVFLGRLKPQKGPHILLEAFNLDSKMDQYNLSVIGSGDDELEYKAFVKSNNLKNVHFLGRLSAEENTEVMEKAGLFVAPSKAEGFALMYIEALCMGLPVIGFPPNIREHNELLGMKVGLEFDANNDSPENLAKLIHEAMNSELTDIEYRRKIMKRAREEYSFDRFKQRYLDVYENLLN